MNELGLGGYLNYLVYSGSMAYLQTMRRAEDSDAMSPYRTLTGEHVGPFVRYMVMLMKGEFMKKMTIAIYDMEPEHLFVLILRLTSKVSSDPASAQRKLFVFILCIPAMGYRKWTSGGVQDKSRTSFMPAAPRVGRDVVAFLDIHACVLDPEAAQLEQTFNIQPSAVQAR
jgi:hypothetical protein